MCIRDSTHTHIHTHTRTHTHTSAKTRDGVQEAFEELVHKVLQTPSLYTMDSPSGSFNVTGQEGGQSEDKGWGCGCCGIMLYVHNTSQYYIISMEDFYSRTRSTHTSRLTVPYYRTVLISPSLTLHNYKLQHLCKYIIWFEK